MEEKDFWNRVKELMASQGILQKDMAEAAGVSIGSFKNWLCRNILPDCVKAVKIANKLGTTVEYLVTGNSDNFTEAESELIGYFRKTPDTLKYLTLHNAEYFSKADAEGHITVVVDKN